MLRTPTRHKIAALEARLARISAGGAWLMVENPAYFKPEPLKDSAFNDYETVTYMLSVTALLIVIAVVVNLFIRKP